MCRNGECIDSSFKCNDEWDCFDGSDENGCREWKLIHAWKALGLEAVPETTTPKPEECDLSSHFACESSNECLPLLKRCDGTPVCFSP